MHNQVNELKRILKGKSVAEHISTPPPQHPPVQRSSESLSVDELKSLLHAKLLSQAEEGGSVESDLIGTLRQQTESGVVTRSEFNEFKAEIRSSFTTVTESIQSLSGSIQKSFESLSERMKAPEDTCKSQDARNENMMIKMTQITMRGRISDRKQSRLSVLEFRLKVNRLKIFKDL